MAENDIARVTEAEQYKLQANFIFNKLQANVKVYGTNSGWTAADPADIPLALKYIDRALEYFPGQSGLSQLESSTAYRGRS